MNLGKMFEAIGYDSVTGQKKTVTVQAKDLAAAKAQLLRTMPNFVVQAIYPA